MIVLTPRLLEFLMAEGYRYCLSKTLCLHTPGIDVALILKPVKNRPALRRLANGFETYYAVDNEIKIMADGIEDTMAIVELNSAEARQYHQLDLPVHEL